MATLNWPGFGLASISPTLDQPSQSNSSAWTGTRTVITNPWHGKWSFKVTLATRQGDAAFQAARAFFTSLKGQINTFHLPAVEAPQNGNTGVTLSANAAQGATSIALTGVTTALVAGNMVTIAGQLLSLTSVGSLSGSAQTVNFQPSLRAAASSGASVETAKPYALVYLSDSSFTWDIGQWRRYGLTFNAAEAVGETDGADPALDIWTGSVGSGGSGGGSVFTFPQLSSFTSRSLLAAVVSPTDKQVAYLTEVGREGEFVFSTANLSARVTADSAQGIHVAPAADTTGASGAWVRKFTGAPHVAWWGVQGDYNGTSGTDNATAFAACMAAVQALAQAEPDIGSVWFLGRSLSLKDAGRCYTSAPLSIISALDYIEFQGSEIIVPANTFGIVINADTTNVEATRTSGPFPYFCTLNKPKVRGHNGTDRTKHGIWMRRTAFIRDPQVTNISGDGIRIGNSNGHTEGNQNGWNVQNPTIQKCGGDGIHAEGADASAGRCDNYNVALCGRFAVVDLSAAGNKWNGQTADCGIIQSGVNTVPAFVYHSGTGHNWAIVAGQEANTTVTPSASRPDVWIDLGVGTGTDPAIAAWTSGITMEAGGSLKTVGGTGLVQVDHPYDESGPYSVWQINPTTTVRDPIGSVTGTGGYVEFPVAGRLRALGTKEILTTVGGSTSTVRIGGSGVVDIFQEYYDHSGNAWFLQATGGFFGVFDQQAGHYPIAISTPGDGINFGRSTEQNGVLFSRRFALGWSNAGRIVDMDSAAPTSGNHAAGELVFNNAPSAGGKVGWVCTTAGTPGTWKPFGAIDA